MTQHDIEEALDAFIQARLADYDLSSDIEDVMDGYDWQSAVEGVTDDLGLASSESVEELEEIVGRIRERQEEAAANQDVEIRRIQERLASLESIDLVGILDRMTAVEGIDHRRQPYRAKTEERLATLEAVMIGQVADSDPGEIAELSDQASPEVAELSDQASPDHLVEAMDAQRQALDQIMDLVRSTGAVDDAHAMRAKRHATDALQALVDAVQARRQEGQA